MQVRFPSFVQNISFNSLREVALRNPITLAVAGVALGIFALYSLYTWWTTPKSFTADPAPSSAPPSFVYPKSQRAAAFATISASDRVQLENLLGLYQLQNGIMDLPEFGVEIAQADGLSIRDKMTAPVMFGAFIADNSFSDDSPFIAIAVDLVNGSRSIETAIILCREEVEESSGSAMLKEVWSQWKPLFNVETSESLLFPDFFDKDIIEDSKKPYEHPSVQSYLAVQGLVSAGKAAKDRKGNDWLLAKF
jgi:hypothetical protein